MTQRWNFKSTLKHYNKEALISGDATRKNPEDTLFYNSLYFDIEVLGMASIKQFFVQTQT